MKLYRSLLLGLVLALLGALAWHWFSQDLGDVVVRFRGFTYSTTLAFALTAWLLLWFLLWALWWLVRLPIRAWRRHARAQARNRLVNGLEALHQGRWARAASLLERAAAERPERGLALLGARRAAAEAGDMEAAARHQAALLKHDPGAAALDQAERLLAQGRADEALAALASCPALPPRGLRLQAEALVAAGRADEALALLPALRREQALGHAALAEAELRYTAASLGQAPQSNTLMQRWRAVPPKLANEAEVVAAFARRAARLGLEEEGAEALAAALDTRWDEGLAALYGELPGGRGDGAKRLARAEAWLAQHPDSPGLLCGLARLYMEQGQWARAEDHLHRALAQGAGAEAWELLGHVFAHHNDPRAAIAYANALRAGRGETPLTLDGRSLREQIADQAVAELRNEHGLPLLPR
ncbi:heme biosynthesis protein HemY [Arenimonas fontis]|uniref:Tetratricopeptide repeat protein n=1 Tax=Arenimonas fontis TaxID=2608255 RepID=A0A5B2ZBU4_9GAMM|nr:heme biosynthesis HemY N-terminal domain-containing protein [Arenimonas fontis]KAA2284750.1 tetratricopeptide repeat protein [Arenimonas fontis]